LPKTAIRANLSFKKCRASPFDLWEMFDAQVFAPHPDDVSLPSMARAAPFMTYRRAMLPRLLQLWTRVPMLRRRKEAERRSITRSAAALAAMPLIERGAEINVGSNYQRLLTIAAGKPWIS
jgi:hypothetical protein